MRSKTSFKHESLLDAKDIQDLLKAVGKSLAKGRLEFGDSEGNLMLTPNKQLYVKVSASQEDNREQLELKIRWDKKPKKLSDKPPRIKD